MKRANLNRMVTCAVLGLALVLTQPAPSALPQEQPFYAGKTIRIIAGFAPGGTIDIRARMFSRYLPKWIPGNPTIVVQNMTGAGGVVAANYALSVAKPDGLTLLHSPSGVVMNTVLTATSVKYDLRQVPILWLQPDSWITVINPKTTQVRKAEDIVRSSIQLRVGGTGVASVRTLRPKLALELYGVDHTWVTGYKGSSDLLLAFEKGEIHLFEDPQAGYKTNIQPREKEGIAVVLWQTGIMAPDETFERSKILPDVPTLDEVLTKEKKKGPAWEAWKAAVVPQAFQSLTAVTPGVPPDRIAILSRALEKMTQELAFREDFEKTLGQPADALFGEQADRIVKDALKKLFEDYQVGVRYLRDLAKK